MSNRMVSVKINKPSISLPKTNKTAENDRKVYNYLIKKYSHFDYSFSLVCINNLVFNERCRIVARFKDFLILDDNTEFLRRFYNKKELKKRLNKIFNFYESYSKIFPNYMILPENKYLYRNIRKKQKMIDAFNEIKREEEENRNSLKKEISENKLKGGENTTGGVVIFDKNIQESINKCHPSESSIFFNSMISGFTNNNNSNNNLLNDSYTNNSKSFISISINSKIPLSNFGIKEKNNKGDNKNKINLNMNKNVMFNNYYNNIPKQQNILFINDLNDNSINSTNSLANIVKILNGKNISTNQNNQNIIENKVYTTTDPNHSKNNSKKKNKDMNSKKQKYIKKNINNCKIDNIDSNCQNNKNSKNVTIVTPTKKSNTIKKLKPHHHPQQSALNNNKNFISHKQTVSVSRVTKIEKNEGNNTIKIINNINNIIINDSNNNNGMVININTNYFRLNGEQSNINTKDNLKNIISKRVKNKESSINDRKKMILSNRTSSNFTNVLPNKEIKNPSKNKNNQLLSNTHHYNTTYNCLNNKTTTITPSNKITNVNKPKNPNYIKIKTNKIHKAPQRIEIDNFNAKEKKISSFAQKEIKGVTIINTEKKKIISKGLYAHQKLNTNHNLSNKRSPEICNTEGNENRNTIYTSKTNYLVSSNTKDNLNNKTKSNQIKNKFNKQNLIRKQKTNSMHINNKNYFISSFNNNKLNTLSIFTDFNSTMNNKNTFKMIKEHFKFNTEYNLKENHYSKKNAKMNKEIKENTLVKKISAREMKEKYHKLMQGSKIIHGSYDTSNRMHLFKKFSLLHGTTYNSIINSNVFNRNNISEILQKKKYTKKFPISKKNLISPGAKIPHAMNKDKTPLKEREIKVQKNKEQEKAKVVFKKINIIKNMNENEDLNNRRMRYVKKQE